MSESYQARLAFIEIVEEVYRDLGFDPPAMTHDHASSLVMELDVHGTNYEVVHNPKVNFNSCLVETRLEKIDSFQPDEILLHLLLKNYEFSRQYRGCFAADIKDNTILFNFSLPLQNLRGHVLLQAMRENAVAAIDWRTILAGVGHQSATSVAKVSSELA